MKDQHPLTWLLDNTSDSTYQPLHDWIAHLLTGTASVRRPEEVRMPET